ncbi:hypothetical protein JYT51_00510 [Candidatus Amoebophilus asiaticus]|nr:hypothetical protein [Candidatus Amoebophilus asiaticus]
MNKNGNIILLMIVLVLMFSGCARYERDPGEVIIHVLSEPDMLNPLTYRSFESNNVLQKIFLPLLNIDFKSLELIPVLAEGKPEIKARAGGGLLITYNIRKEALWDNGTPVTAKDIEFTLKVIKNPKVNNARTRPYYEFIEDLLLYDDNLRKLTFVCKEIYTRAEAQCGTIPIIPEYIYDPQGLMKEFTLKQLIEAEEELINNPQIINFATAFNSEKFQREKGFIVGSGPYQFKEWKTGQRIVLKKKESWWGEEFKGTNIYFEAVPTRLIYQIINDLSTALVALKGGKIDVLKGMRAKDFLELHKSAKFTEKFNSHTSPQLVFTYLGIYTRLPKFSDKKVRQALAHMIDVDKIIEKICYGMAERVIGPIHPSMKKQYNFDIKPYEYNLEKAKQLLAEAGWKDTNGNGTIDRVIEGVLVEFNIEFIYNSGNDTRKNIGLIFQENARKVGIQVTVTPQEWSVYLENLKNHNFEMNCSGMIDIPLPQDHNPVYHTQSYYGGSNYSGFGNDETDALIDSIRSELDVEKRGEMNKRFQEILHDEVPMIYLYTPKARIAVHKRFTNVYISELRPGFWSPSFSYTEDLQ